MVDEPPVVPNTNVLVVDIVDWKHPVPDPNVPLVVYVKPVAVAIFNTVCNAVVVANIILLEPKAIERVLLLLELNIPVVKLAVNVIVPAVNV